jgi:hypothetical protein
MDTRHFELQDLLSEALIALEAGDRARVEAALRRALAWVEHDWLATPGELRSRRSPATTIDDADDEDD